MRYYLLVVITFLTANLYSQRMISGTVLERGTRETLFGVNIFVKETIRSTKSDIYGKFELNLKEQDSVLVFEMMGYVTQEVDVRNLISAELRIEMEEDAIVIGQVAYPLSRKLDVGYEFRNQLLGAEWEQEFYFARVPHSYNLALYANQKAHYAKVGYLSPALFELWGLRFKPEVNYLSIKQPSFRREQYDLGVTWENHWMDFTTSILKAGHNYGWKVKTGQFLKIGGYLFEGWVGAHGSLARVNKEWQYEVSMSYKIPKIRVFVTGAYNKTGAFNGVFLKFGKYIW